MPTLRQRSAVFIAVVALLTAIPYQAFAGQEHARGAGSFEHVHALAVDAEGRSLWLGTHAGLFRSEDGGRSWQNVVIAVKHAHLDVMAITAIPEMGRMPGRWSTAFGRWVPSGSLTPEPARWITYWPTS